MAENPTEPIPPLDVRNIHQLVRLMKRYDLSAIDLVDGATKIRLRRRGPESAQVAMPVSAPAPVVTAAPAPIQAPVETPAPSNDLVIESPMVGTFYSSPAPDAPPFITVGTAVRPETTACVIEAMKVFTDIPAGVSGTVTEVLVKSGQPVEFGQALFRVRPA
jgi:acetyl-CoA carboxylase biotin carboxyl carrier protein